MYTEKNKTIYQEEKQKRKIKAQKDKIQISGFRLF